MPATRKRRTRSTSPKSSEVIAPGGGTQTDVNNLANNLGLDSKAVHAILNCQGAGLSAPGEAGDTSSATAAGATGTSAWADFMQEEGFGGTAGAGDTKTTAPGNDTKRPRTTTDDNNPSTSTSTTSTANAKIFDAQDPTPVNNGPTTSAFPDENAVRSYALPLVPLMRIPSHTSHGERTITPGLLAQTGTLDSTILGRTKRPLTQPQDLQEPTLLTPTLFRNLPVAFVAASSSSCHSIAITTDGTAYLWGRNEMGQCGTGTISACVPVPTEVVLPGGEGGVFVGGAVGKNHSILVRADGTCFAVGWNKFGQCGINSSVESCVNWRKCIVGKGEKLEDDGGEGDGVKIIQASCGENFTLLLSSIGHIYTAGLGEFGQLANGETGEHFIQANKLAFANNSKFERQFTFVMSPSDASQSSLLFDDSERKKSTVPMPNSGTIRIGSIACGKNHAIAVEAPSNTSQPARVFTWGCGAYGCLGHNVQQDEYRPRLVSQLTGPLFQQNHPVRPAAGAQSTMCLTKNGHVYYWGKHRTVGEATMRPSLIDALANNGHVVQCVGGGFQTVFCGTKNGVTVSWGNGSSGELGYGGEAQKSSSKPKFVDKLDECLVTEVACGYGA